MKQIQLIDLCSRVPYHPKGHVVNACNAAECDEWLTCATFPMFTSITNNSRLYLRPMSSMTEEERNEYNNLYYQVSINVDNNGNTFRDMKILEWLHISWFLKNHFDFMGLIPKGLAIEVTEENNPYL